MDIAETLNKLNPDKRLEGLKAKHAQELAELSDEMDHQKRALLLEMHEAEVKAWLSLAKYKFVMFGYWAGVWVHLNRISGSTRRNPFTGVVKFARNVVVKGGP